MTMPCMDKVAWQKMTPIAKVARQTWTPRISVAVRLMMMPPIAMVAQPKTTLWITMRQGESKLAKYA